MSVVVPWDERRFQYTVKDVGRPVAGRIAVAGTAYDVGPADSFAVLDHGRGRWPYSVSWNWGALHGLVDGRRISVQVGGRWTDGTGSTENAVVVDGVVHKVGEELVWEYDDTGWSSPWRVHGARLDVTVTPFHVRAASTNLLLVASRTHQAFGTARGWVCTSDGERIEVDGLVGWVEEVVNRW
jgi:hypothetical protein